MDKLHYSIYDIKHFPNCSDFRVKMCFLIDVRQYLDSKRYTAAWNVFDYVCIYLNKC